MGNIIYWKELDEPIKYIDPITKKEVIKTGDYVCKDERVSKFWIYGSASANPSDGKMYARSSLLFKKKDGEDKFERWESEKVEMRFNPDNAQEAIDNLINQAEQYLQSF